LTPNGNTNNRRRNSNIMLDFLKPSSPQQEVDSTCAVAPSTADVGMTIDEETMAKIESVPSANADIMMQPEPPIGDDVELESSKDPVSSNLMKRDFAEEPFLCGMDCSYMVDHFCWALDNTVKAVEDARDAASKALSESSEEEEDRDPADANTSTRALAPEKKEEDQPDEDDDDDEPIDSERAVFEMDQDRPMLSFADASIATVIFTKKSTKASADPYEDDNKGQIGQAEKCQCAGW
jgi:hypothetical protein